MSEEIQEKKGQIKFWTKQPKALGGDKFSAAFKVGEDWYNTEPASQERLNDLKAKFPSKTMIAWKQKIDPAGNRPAVIIDSMEAVQEPKVEGQSNLSAQQESSPQEKPAQPEPQRDMSAVQKHQAERDYKEALKRWKKDRRALRQVFFKEANASMRRSDVFGLAEDKYPEYAEKVMELTKAFEDAYNEQFPDEKAPEEAEENDC